MKDAQGVVLYVGKAKNLRNRAGHYFTKAAAEDRRTADLVKLIADIDFLPAESEVDALLLEARLVKDIQPRFNVELKDDKIVSLSADPHARGFPARRVHAHAAAPRRQALRPVHQRPHACGRRSRCCSGIFQFRTCSLDIRADDEPLALVSAVPAAQHPPVYGPVQLPRHARRSTASRSANCGWCWKARRTG